MASLHFAILAVSVQKRDVQKRAALCMLDHYNKISSNRRSASIRRAKRTKVVQQILFIRRNNPDGLYENFLSLIDWIIGNRAKYNIRAAFSLSKQALVIDFHLRWKFEKCLAECVNRT